MSYCTWALIQAYKGYQTSQETAVTAMIARAQQAIDSYCARTFEASADSTRYFDAEVDVDGPTLYFDRDICSITTVTNNADNGSGGVVVTSSQYVTLPRNTTPYYGIKLLTSSGLYWTYTSDPEKGISIAGKWAYSATAPVDIVQACMRLTAYYYELKDSQVFDITAMPEQGTMIIPKGLPQDVKVILDPYRRLT